MRNLFVLCALMIHGHLNAAVSWWLISTQITQADFCMLMYTAAQHPFWGNSCEEREEEVKCEQNVSWLL